MMDPNKDENVREVVDFAGFTIAIENPQGSVRHWTDSSGEKGSTHMRYSYGYIAGTEGLDGDDVDVFLGPDEHAPRVYIITQNKKNDGDYTGIDEQKVMLGFHTSVEAKAAYTQHYDNARFFKEMIDMSVEEFRSKLKSRKGKILKSNRRLEKSQLNRNTGSAKMSDMFYLDDLSKAFKPVALKEGSTIVDKSSSQEDEEDGAEKSLELLRSVTASCETDLKKKAGKKDEEEDEDCAVSEAAAIEPAMSKALRASMIAGLSRRARMDAAHAAGMAVGLRHQGQANIEPVTIDLHLGNDRPVPLHEGMPVRSRPVATPFEVPVQKAASQDEHGHRPASSEEAVPLWRRR